MNFKPGDFVACFYPNKKHAKYIIYSQILRVDDYYTWYNLEFQRIEQEYIWKLNQDGRLMTQEEKVEFL